MELITTYPAAVNSKATVTMGVLDQVTTIVEVLDATVLPEAPNLLVLGTDQTAETVLMTARENNTLTIQRAVQGIAKSWPAGTQIARNFTGKDWDDMRSNVEAIATKILGLTASDVGAVRMIDSNSMGSFSTLLDVANSLEHGGSFTIDNSLSVVTAEDYPVTNKEMSFIVFGSKDNIRRIIIGFLYNDLTFNIYKRDIFQGKWKTEWSNITQRFLPLDGSVPMSGILQIATAGDGLVLQRTITGVIYKTVFSGGAYVPLAGLNDCSAIIRYVDGVEKARLLFNEKGVGLLDRSTNAGNLTSYLLFGEHNKPSGSYTGNGSATSRTIETGGLGNVAVVWSANGTVLLINLGGIARQSTNLYAISGEESNCANGKIILTTTSRFLNENGKKYVYQVL